MEGHKTNKGEAEGAGTIYQGEDKRLKGILPMYVNTCRERAMKTEQTFFRGAQGQNKRQWAQNKTQEVPSEHRETSLP